MMADFPDICPRCDVPTRVGRASKVLPDADQSLMPDRVLGYCPKCKQTWELSQQG